MKATPRRFAHERLLLYATGSGALAKLDMSFEDGASPVEFISTAFAP